MTDKSGYKVIYVDAEHHKVAKMIATEMYLSVKDAVELLLEGNESAFRIARRISGMDEGEDR